MAQYVKHKRSSAVVNGAPKLPTPANIGVGEIAINFADGYETLSILNSSSGIATFSSDEILDSKYATSGNVKSLVSELSGAVESNEFVIAQAFNNQNDRIASLEDAGFITGYTETDPTVPSWAKQSTKPTYTAAEVGAMATSERSNYLGTGTTYFDDVEYDSNTKRINFKKNSSVIDYVDATDFIKDGMVSSVTVSNGNLVISFNTDAGREDIELALTQIFNPNNYYDKTAADAKFLSAYTETDPTVVSFAKRANGYYTIGVSGVWPVDPEVEDTYGDKALPTWHRVKYELNKYALSAHTHSNYSLTSHTHTAADIGAMATSERSNYLPTGTTLDNVADGTTRKLSNYALSSHTHAYLPLTGGDLTGEVYVHDGNKNLVYSYLRHDEVKFDSGGTTARTVSIMPYWKSGNTFGTNTLFLPQKDGMIATLDDVPTEASLTSSGFTKNGNVQSDWMELDQTADSYILNSPVFSATGAFDKVYGIRTNIIDGGDGCKYFFPDGDGLWMAGYNENDWTNRVLITGDVIKNAGISGGESGKYSASTTQFGLIKIGNFLSGHNGFVSVATGTSNTTVARGDHSHSEYATTAQTANFITSADTKVKMYTVTGVTNSVTGRAIASALPQDFYTSVQSDVANGVLPVVKLSYIDGSSVLLPLQINPITQGELLFTAVYYNQTYTFTFNNNRLAYCDYKSYWLQDSNTLYADIKRSGFTQSAITAVTINGAAASVSNGVASANLPVLPTVTSSDNGKVLTVVNGQWSATTPLTVYTGNNAPDNSMGNNGDIYLQTS